MFAKYRWNKWEILAYFLSPFCLFLAMEILRFHTAKEYMAAFGTGMWLWAGRTVLTYLFLLAFQSFFTIITTRPFWGSVINYVLFLTMSTISYLLGFFTGTPLLPNHLFLIGSVGEITGFVGLIITPQMIYSYLFALVCLGGYFFVSYRTKKKEIGELKRSIPWGIGAVVFALLSFHTMSYNTLFHAHVLGPLGVANQEFNPWEDYVQNGTVLTFFPRLERLTVKPLEGYSQATVEQLKNEYASYTIGVTETEKKPHVIVIQSEALWDPTLLPNVEFSEDPMPFMRSLQKESGGEFACISIGGGTCLPEFEVLTGFSMDFLPISGYPYSQYITGNTQSVVRAFSDHEYETVGIHTYKRRFYSRNTAYPFLGFDQFIDVDDIENPEKDGTYVSDRELNRQIISAFENRTKESAFIFAVSMQNHGAYEPNRYSEHDISISCDGMSEEDQAGLLSYVQGVKHTDQATKELIEYFENCGEPVIFVMYGDHLPLLGSENSTYRAGGLLGEEQSATEVPTMYETPFIVWTNMEEELVVPEKVSGGTVGLNLMKWAGLSNIPWSYKAIDDFYQNYTVLRNGAKYPTGNVSNRTLDEMLYNYELVQYDLLLGKQYGRK